MVAASAALAARRSAAQRERNVFGKSRILVRKKRERRTNIDDARANRFAASFQRRAACGDGIDDAWIDEMLDAQHARGERAGIVAREQRHGPLHDDASAVVFIIYEMRRDAGDSNAGGNDGAMH